MIRGRVLSTPAARPENCVPATLCAQQLLVPVPSEARSTAKENWLKQAEGLLAEPLEVTLWTTIA